MKIRILCLLLTALLLAGCGTEIAPTEPPYALPKSLYAPDDFRMEGDYLACAVGNAVMGIDVSSHQGAIDWQAVADAGVKFINVEYYGQSSSFTTCVD